jgi:tetratricopeptide (TPR) repeat protein
VSKGRHIQPPRSASLTNGSTRRWGLALIGFFLLTAPAFANGVIVSGFKPDGTSAVTVAVSRSSVQNATTRALADCQKTASACRVVHTFSKSCVATVLFASRQLDIGTGATVAEAQQEAMRICQSRGGPCAPQYSACDPPPADALTTETPTSTHSAATPFAGIFVMLLIVGLGAYFWDEKRIAFPFWRSALPLSSPPPTTQRQTEAAVRQMKAAWDYMEGVSGHFRDNKRSYAAMTETLETLDRAAEHMLNARELDPAATLDLSGEPVNQHQLLGRLFAYEGFAQSILSEKSPEGFAGRNHLRRAAAAFQQAAEYDPHPAHFLGIADVYALLDRKAEALQYSRKALDLDPDYVQATQMLNSIPSIKELCPYPRLYDAKRAWLAVCLAGIPFGALGLLAGNQEYLWAFAPVGLTAFILLILNKLRNRLAQIPGTYAHFRARMKQYAKRQRLHSLYEARWRREAGSWF